MLKMLNIGIQALRSKWIIDFGNLPEKYIEVSYLLGLIRRKKNLIRYDKYDKPIYCLW
jgi:hypothetical protein